MMERLEGGLEKLKSTAAQVDDLKEKLAAQEVRERGTVLLLSQTYIHIDGGRVADNTCDYAGSFHCTGIK